MTQTAPKHTPGKWNVLEGWEDSHGNTVIRADIGPAIGLAFLNNEEPERDANARLMAAAWLLPEVVEVLTLFAARLDLAEQESEDGDTYMCAAFHQDLRTLLAQLTEAGIRPGGGE